MKKPWHNIEYPTKDTKKVHNLDYFFSLTSAMFQIHSTKQKIKKLKKYIKNLRIVLYAKNNIHRKSHSIVGHKKI